MKPKGPHHIPRHLRLARHGDHAVKPIVALDAALLDKQQTGGGGALMPGEIDQISHQLGQCLARLDVLASEVTKLRGTMYEHNQQLMIAYTTRDQVQGLAVRTDGLEKREAERIKMRHKIIGFALGASLFGGAGGAVGGPKLWAWLFMRGM